MGARGWTRPGRVAVRFIRFGRYLLRRCSVQLAVGTGLNSEVKVWVYLPQ